MGPHTSSDKDEPKSIQRKLNKPLIEKRRRARINECLSQLKEIVLEANKGEANKPSKLEKADILEMTVDFVKSRLVSHSDLNARNATPPSTLSDGERKYLAGYSKCLEEVSTFLEQSTNTSHILQRNIVQHMSNKRDQKNCAFGVDMDEFHGIDDLTLQSNIEKQVPEQNPLGTGVNPEQTQSSNERNETEQGGTFQHLSQELKQHPSELQLSFKVSETCKQVPVLPVTPQCQTLDLSTVKPTLISEKATKRCANMKKTCIENNGQIHLEVKSMTQVRPSYILPPMLQPVGMLYGGQFLLLQINPTTVPQTTTHVQWNSSFVPDGNTDTPSSPSYSDILKNANDLLECTSSQNQTANPSNVEKRILTDKSNKLKDGNGHQWRPW
ncbi:uncharacterized protein LOC128203375 isoform X1 [Mya arenaria]|uniref:uncharacterized protein LOC128203375 isoform X1 n=1 Tax=Mya arenaria TaxID=6604 RepID=UPI0022E3756B|nr:uncharacterized protein LOC128203375 isoform X1 [Mya arenaria]